MSTLRKLERDLLRKKYGNRVLSDIYRDRNKPKHPRESAFKRGIKNLIKTILGRW